MKDLHVVLGALVMALNGGAAALGAWRWWRLEQSPLFWRLVRAGQAALVAAAALGGLELALGHKARSGLHYLYGLLPLAVYFIAEQLRVASAETVLEARGLADAQAVGALPERDQRSVVTAIVRRELGLLTLAALVAVALAVRAATTS